MSDPDQDPARLRKRLNRILGQIEALQRALENDAGSTKILQQATACRGALDSFIAEVIEGHIRTRIVGTEDAASAKSAAEELIGIVHSYL